MALHIFSSRNSAASSPGMEPRATPGSLDRGRAPSPAVRKMRDPDSWSEPSEPLSAHPATPSSSERKPVALLTPSRRWVRGRSEVGLTGTVPTLLRCTRVCDTPAIWKRILPSAAWRRLPSPILPVLAVLTLWVDPASSSPGTPPPISLEGESAGVVRARGGFPSGDGLSFSLDPPTPAPDVRALPDDRAGDPPAGDANPTDTSGGTAVPALEPSRPEEVPARSLRDDANPTAEGVPARPGAVPTRPPGVSPRVVEVVARRCPPGDC
mmetsp:Transcript_69482/g.166335  ORF Transcript_69482/g.166335 Transcript_69482/m.166335 type:complete len:267 (-) Transcript_69482:143-943(-)